MPKNRGRQKETNKAWEPNWSEDNDLGINNSSHPVDAEEIIESGDDVETERLGRKVNSTRPQRNLSARSLQHGKSQSLGPWTEAVTGTVQSMGAAHKAIKDLQERFKSHEDDLKMMEQTRETLKRQEKECEEKDEQIRKQTDAITILSNMNVKYKQGFEEEMKKIEQEKQELEREKAKSEKRVVATMAEERGKLRGEFEKLINTHGQSHDKRKKELEAEFALLMDENNRRVIALDSDNKRLVTTMEEQRVANVALSLKLEKSTEYCDVLERAKDSIRNEKLAQEKEFKLMKMEFALSQKPKEYFVQRFADIYRAIEDISSKYVNDIDGKDIESLHEQLVATDNHFESVPIDESEDSHSLCVAHTQRIISEAVCEHIWKPFRSEFTLLHPDAGNLLTKISVELAKAGQGSRVVNVWTALTMRALQYLQDDSILSRASESKESHRPNSSGRAEAVISQVFSLISPLVSSSQYENLRVDLVKLANSSIAVWDDAQTCEFKVTVHLELNPTHREEWRSQKFDPLLPSSESEFMTFASHTHPRIFTLFPRVIALEVMASNENESGPPGSWPSDSDRTLETCIHHGIGLPESSPLVVRGKEAQEEAKECIASARQNAMKDIHKRRRLKAGGDRYSIESSTSGLLSPSQQWTVVGAMKSTER